MTVGFAGILRRRPISVEPSLGKIVGTIMYKITQRRPGNIKTSNSETVWISKEIITNRRSNLYNGQYKKPSQY